MCHIKQVKILKKVNTSLLFCKYYTKDIFSKNFDFIFYKHIKFDNSYNIFKYSFVIKKIKTTK